MQIQGDNTLKQRVSLSISCRNLKNLDVLSKSDPLCEVYIKDRKTTNWTLLGKTEQINNNLNPDFSTIIYCDYYFEREQNIRFDIFDIDNKQQTSRDYIGSTQTTIGSIIGSLKQTFVADLKDEKSTRPRGKIVVRLDNVNSTNDEVRLRVSSKLQSNSGCCGSQDNPYYIISRARDINNDKDFVRTFKSTPMLNTTQPMWNPQKIKLAQISNGLKNLPIKFELYQQIPSGTDILYGEGVTTIQILQDGNKQIELRDKKGKSKGIVLIDGFQIREMPNFMEYLRSGWAINMSFAIDYTASNGEKSDPNSLHKQDPSGARLNQYEQAILSVGKVMEPYALNQQFATFGFGGIPRFTGSNQISHCFNLNGAVNPQIQGLQNVYSAYKRTINQIGLAGPTHFSTVLQALLVYVQQCLQYQMYHCLMILTDGEIHDMQATVDLIVELSRFPVSIIIIGVGNEDFEKMNFLDSDNQTLRNSKGQAAQRDIVQFVRFQDYAAQDISLLAEEVLKEMPDQIVGYMMENGIKPQKQEWLSVDQVIQNHPSIQ